MNSGTSRHAQYRPHLPTPKLVTKMANTIAFSRATSTLPDGEEIFDIFLINDDGAGLTQLTHHAIGTKHDSSNPVFSPDGTQIVFETMRNRDDLDNGNTCEIYRMKRDGTNVTRLTHDDYDDQDPNWSMDGTKILFAGARPRPDMKLHSMSSTNGSSITELPIANWVTGDWSPRYSHDGTKIAFIRDFGGGKRSVFIANADGSNPRDLTTSPCICDAPRWSPDGNKIVYASDHHNPSTQKFEIYVMDVVDSNGNGEGDNRIRLTAVGPSATSESPVFSPDGTQIAYSNNTSGHYDICLMDADGSNKKTFAAYGESCYVSDWK